MGAESWRRRQVRDFAARCKVVNVSGEELPPFSITKAKGIVLQSDRYNKQIATDLRKYVVAKRGQFAFDPMSLYYGAIGLVQAADRGLISPDYVAFETDDSMDRAFLDYFLRSPEQVARYESVAETGNQFGKRRRVYWSVFEELEFSLPTLPEQRKIATILSSVDEAIEGTQAVIDQLQVVKKAMMADLLTRGIPGRHKKFKQTEIGEVPEEWEATTVGELGEFSGGNGFRPPDWSSAGLPIIRIQNLNGSQDFHYFAGKPDLDWLVEPGELLFAWAGSRGASFGPCIWPGPQGVLNQHIHRIKPFPSIRKRFFFYLLQIITQEVEKKAHGFKDTLVHLRKAELTNWPVALPWITEQDMIVASLDSAGDRLLSEAAFLDGLKATKSALMSVLLTGEVRVRADEESAA